MNEGVEKNWLQQFFFSRERQIGFLMPQEVGIGIVLNYFFFILNFKWTLLNFEWKIIRLRCFHKFLVERDWLSFPINFFHVCGEKVEFYIVGNPW